MQRHFAATLLLMYATDAAATLPLTRLMLIDCLSPLLADMPLFRRLAA